MFIAVIDPSDEVETQKQFGALHTTCDGFGTHMRIECDAPADLDKFANDLVASCNAKVMK